MMASTSQFALAIACAATMGFAIQRGATCLVAAVDEVVKQRRARRLSYMIEASLWVLGCVLLGNLFGLTMLMPQAYDVGLVTVAGGALLGVGAAINRACVFGAVARFGSGEWAYLGTPVGFYFGCLATQSFWRNAITVPYASGSSVLTAPGWIAALFGLCMLWRALQLFWSPRVVSDNQSQRTDNPFMFGRLFEWTPRVATIIIGLSFFVLLVDAGPWAYTDVLAELAQMHVHGPTGGLTQRITLLLALLAGTVVGGWTSGGMQRQTITAAGVVRCISGGFLMGVGGSLIPGGNDGLLLIGLPLLLPYALLALTTMCLSIAIWLVVARQR